MLGILKSFLLLPFEALYDVKMLLLIEESEDFDLSITLNAVASTYLIPSSKKSRKTSPVHEHCRTATAEEKEEKPGVQWI